MKANGRQCVKPCARRDIVFFPSNAQVCVFFTAMGCQHLICLLFVPACFVLWVDRQKYRRDHSSGQESAVHLHLKDKGHSFEDSNVKVAREDVLKGGVKEAIFVRLEQLFLNSGGGLRHNLSSTFKTVLSTLPKQITPIHTWVETLLSSATCDPSNSPDVHLLAGF